MLRIRNLDAGYGSLGVLRRISLHVNPGEIVTIIGANGAGKSTLLRTISGLLRAQAGEILFQGTEISRAPTERIVFSGCSLVPEGRQVFAAMPVKENLLLGGYVQFKRGNRHDVERDQEYVYGLFPVLKQRERQLAGTLSGGEQQMLAMGRALMARPKLVMLDEPSMGLAPLMVKEIFNIIVKLRGEGKTVLLVEQNARSALKIANRGYVLETGRIILEGEAEDLLANRNVQRAYLGKEQ
ncbi:MAG TPA: ABC transporter ATP-binding protein [Nitrospirota bacterium]|nr:ABC transporter ATP-binding protein [Nitrospirota bacterium]